MIRRFTKNQSLIQQLVLILVISGITFQGAQSQNIVPNPGFETFSSCPVGYNGGFGPLLCEPWYVPTMGSSDYFNACNTGVVGVPDNAFGSLPANTGVAYAGGLYYYAGLPSYREYLQVQLTEPMVAGQAYTVSMYYSVGELTCGVDRLGVHISNNQVTEPGNTGPMSVTPQLELNVGVMENNDWELYTDCYVALGGEEWITIGNFYNDAETTLQTGCPLWGGMVISYIFIDDVSVEEGPPPGEVLFSLGPDTTVCGSVELEVPVDNANYLWQDGSSGQTYSVSETGEYYVMVTTGCNIGYDTIEVTVLPEVGAVDLGEPMETICPGDAITYGFDPDLGDYLWQDNTTSPDYQITDEGTYSVTLTTPCGIYEDQIIVDVLDPPAPISLGNDTTLCPLTTLSLTFDPQLGDFVWQDGSTNPAFTIDGPGTYAVTISNMCGEVEDDIIVDYYPEPIVFFAEDTVALCDGETFEFNFDPAIGEYFWSDGAEGPDYVVTGPGTYSVTVVNPCGSDFATVVADYDFEPEVDLGPDLTICPQQLPYTINLEGLLDAESFLWDDGSTNPDFAIYSAGVYGVTVSNDCFEVWDFIEVAVEDAPPAVNLPADTTLCAGESLFLDIANIPGTYLWQDGNQAGVYEVTSSGTYSVTVSNACGEDQDTIVVEVSQPLPGVDLGPDVSICPGEQVVFYAGLSGFNFTWQDGSTLDSLVVTDEATVILTLSDDCAVIADTVEVIVSGEPPMAGLPESIALCSGDTVTLQTGVGGAMYQWSTGATSSSIPVFDPGEYILTVTNSCGSDIDTTLITDLGDAPAFDLGPDLDICEGDKVTLDPGTSGNYTWQDGSTNTTFEVVDSGTVVLTVTNSCGSLSDSLQVTLLDPVPSLDLGPDTSVCPGTEVLFDPGIPGVTYLWSDGSSGNNYLATDEGEISLSISNACGFSADTVVVSYLPDAPALDLGGDFSICPGESVTLDPAIPNVSYLWSDGSTGNTFEVVQSGEVILTVSNPCGNATDTILVSEDANGPILDLGPDIMLCEGESAIINPGLNGVSYLWQDGSTTSTLSVTVTTTVILEVSNGCGADRDTIEVVISGSGPDIDLGPDLTLCNGDQTVLTVPTTGNSITWSDGSDNASFVVNSSGTYSVTVTNMCGVSTDSIDIIAEISPMPFDLGPDQVICPGESVVLTAPVIGASSTLEWSTGSNANEIVIMSTGQYTLTIENICGIVSDIVGVDVDTNMIVGPAQANFPICPGESVVLSAEQTFPVTYSWNTGSALPSIMAAQPGDFVVTITSACDEVVEDFVVNEGDCRNENVFIPNVFSPNYDNINDVFRIEFDKTDLAEFGVWIYDRWGEVLFSSADPDFEWNGELKDSQLLPGVYIYQVLIRRNDQPERRLKGDITLVR